MVFKIFKDELKIALEGEGYIEPTLPQKLAIPRIMEGKNVLILSPTGFGKTEAAILSIFNKIIENKEMPGVRALYITPLRSLNRDLFGRLLKIANKIGIDVDLRHGDTTQRERREQVSDPSQIMISTPETLQSLLSGKNSSKILKNVEWVIVDEIHELFNSKRGSQLTIALERLEHLAQRRFQRIGLSATIGDPKEISKFLMGAGRTCEILDASDIKKYDISLEYPKISDEDRELSKKLGINEKAAYSMRRIDELVSTHIRTIIFVNTREGAESLGAKFKKWRPELKLDVHHSSLSKEMRIEVENKFKNGELRAVIATSSLELGIDIGSVDLIIQYGSPRQVTKLTQRIGRSGHRVGGVSKGVLLCGSSEDYLEAKAILKKREEGWLERQPMPKKPFDVLAHQIVGICMDFNLTEKNPTAKDIFDIVRKAYPFEDVTLKEVEKIVDFMKEIYLIGQDDVGLYRTRKGLLYYFNNLSMIPNERNFNVINVELNKKIGVLHQGFVTQYISRGSIFIMKGEPWKVSEFDGEKVTVVSSSSVEGAIPSWEGEMIAISREVASMAGDLREDADFEELKVQKERFAIPNSKKILVETYMDFVIVHSCFGSRINQTLSRILSALISSKTGLSITVKSDAYRIIFKMNSIEWNYVFESLKEIKSDWIDGLIRGSIKNSPLFNLRFHRVAKRFGVVNKDVVFSNSTLSKLVDIYKNTPIFEEAMKEINVDKLDVDGAMDIINGLREGRIKLVNSKNSSLSPLGLDGLDYSPIMMGKMDGKAKEIVRMVEDRLNTKKMWFRCMSCKNSLGMFTVENIPEELKCSCNSKLIGFVSEKNKKLVEGLLGKEKNTLSKDEVGKVEAFEESAELFLNNGKVACFVMAGYGVGPTTAKRILRQYCKTKEELVMKIIEAERTFAMNKQFWQ